jgi:hypothetical protein
MIYGATVQGLQAIDLKLSAPLTGRFQVDVSLDGETILVPGAPVDVVLGVAPTVSILKCRVLRAGAKFGTTTAVLLGGPGDLQAKPVARYFAQATVGLVIDSLLAPLTMTRAPNCDPSVMARPLKNFVVAANRPVAAVLSDLVTAQGALYNWRVTPTGQVWVGVETWVVSPCVLFDLVTENPAHGRRIIAPLGPLPWPGETFDGGRVASVETRLIDGELRVEIWLADGMVAVDRLSSGLTDFVKKLSSGIDFHAFYEARVLAQAADGSLQLQPSDARLPTMTGVPIRLGLPGVKVKVAPGATCFVGFENGSPTAPCAILWGNAALMPAGVEIGATPTSFVALATQVTTALNLIVNAINSHTHEVVGPLAKPSSLPPPYMPCAPSTNVASVTLKST